MDVSEYLQFEVQFGASDPWREGLHFLLDPVPTAVPCNILGPNRPTDETVEQYWNEVALTSHEDRALEALNLIADVVPLSESRHWNHSPVPE